MPASFHRAPWAGGAIYKDTNKSSKTNRVCARLTFYDRPLLFLANHHETQIAFLPSLMTASSAD
jgi:hypothetical protein